MWQDTSSARSKATALPNSMDWWATVQWERMCQGLTWARLYSAFTLLPSFSSTYNMMGCSESGPLKQSTDAILNHFPSCARSAWKVGDDIELFRTLSAAVMASRWAPSLRKQAAWLRSALFLRQETSTG